MTRQALTFLVAATTACGSPQAVVSTCARLPELLESTTQIEGAVPPGAGSLILTEDGVACVADEGLLQIVCAATGNWAKATQVGRKGQGPGEFQGALSLGIGENGSVIVSDWGNRRLTWIDPKDGTSLKSLPAPSLFRQSGPEQDGRVIGVPLTGGFQGTVAEYRTTPPTVTRVAVNSETGELEQEVRFVLPEAETTGDSGMMLTSAWQLPDGRVGTLVSPSQIGYWNATGEFLETLESPLYSPRFFSEAEAVEYWRALERGSTRMGGSPRDSARTVSKRMGETARAYRGFPTLGPEGTLWFLTTGNGSPGESEFEIFFGTECLGRLKIEEAIRAFDIRGQTLAVLKDSGTVDEFGFEQSSVRLFEIRIPSVAR